MSPIENGPATNSRAASTSDNTLSSNSTASRQVSWWSVHEFVAPLLAMQEQPWPIIGTPAWCALGDHDARKQAALFDAAQQMALQLETDQQARCEASRTISAALDWSALAQRYRVDTEFYAARPWLKRVVV
jgi:hypothetical protein